ncbi:ArsR/SmtB family transcription factor [Acinetobacter pollinis]|uniref:Helix-turn-helix transcriptional regulator n=1 Tax=Acinetobacter pollinis TaxID=2605270 RepID=A0ABU6DQH7_9GAMM|nr:helix-turn-helix transcriptional regulator [Acinetobacter pollinis]MEB5475907.1 helix-turn-helix transcriptional regulator [Acinetobacter pollinis]
MPRVYQHPLLEDISLTQIFFALSDPVRLKIIRKLLIIEKLNSLDLVPDIHMPKSTLTHHTKTLREAGLTYTKPEGRNCWISIRRETFEKKYPELLQLILKGETHTHD